ncbi:hypothetical protein MJ547_04620, partial [Burkholderia gladioli]
MRFNTAITTAVFALFALPVHAQSLEDQAKEVSSDTRLATTPAIDPTQPLQIRTVSAEDIATVTTDADGSTITSYTQPAVAFAAPASTRTEPTDGLGGSEHLLGSVSTPLFNWMDNGHPWVNYVGVNLASHHFNREIRAANHYSEFNPGLNITRTNGTYAFSAGIYRNSIRAWSKYALFTVSPDVLKVKLGPLTFSPGVSIGGITGYEKKTTTYTTVHYMQPQSWPQSPVEATRTVATTTVRSRPLIPAIGLNLGLYLGPWLATVFVVPTVRRYDVDGFAGFQVNRAF